ncbi:MAG: hypothetical protein QNI99_11510 [Woeseiaceae bacterium]|nr:hypothetical protein [Woeseiaceae bacterium]
MRTHTDYPEDSREAVLRIAILVTDSDGSWHELERAQLENVYKNVCMMLDEDLDEEIVAQELDEISTDVLADIEDLARDEDMESYWQTCSSSIVSEDIQQLAVGAAYALAMGDSEIDEEERTGISRLCDAWDVSLKDAEAIWND